MPLSLESHREREADKVVMAIATQTTMSGYKKKEKFILKLVLEFLLTHILKMPYSLAKRMVCR